MRAHPEVEIITRDRAPAYAEGATRGAPKAQQIADRWHLLHNLTEAYGQLLQHQNAALRECAQELNEHWRAACAPVTTEQEPLVVLLTYTLSGKIAANPAGARGITNGTANTDWDCR